MTCVYIPLHEHPAMIESYFLCKVARHVPNGNLTRRQFLVDAKRVFPINRSRSGCSGPNGRDEANFQFSFRPTKDGS